MQANSTAAGPCIQLPQRFRFLKNFGWEVFATARLAGCPHMRFSVLNLQLLDDRRRRPRRYELRPEKKTSSLLCNER